MTIVNNNIIVSSGTYTHNMSDDNLPGYFHDYHVRLLRNHGSISSSLLSLLPSNVANVRILNIECNGTLFPVFYPGTRDVLSFWTIIFDFTDNTLFRNFTLEYGISGTLNVNGTIVNASKYMNYIHDPDNFRLYIRINLNSLKDIDKTVNLPFTFNINIQDDLIEFLKIREVYQLFHFPFQFTGQGQTITIPSNFLAGWFYRDIVKYLQSQGIVKTISELQMQISYENTSSFEQFYFDGDWYDIPASDGFTCTPDPLVLPNSDELSMNLQYILSVAPNAKIIIAYFGCNCDPSTGMTTDAIDAEMELSDFYEDEMDRFDIISDSYGHGDVVYFSPNQQEKLNRITTELYARRKPFFEASGNDGIEDLDFYSMSPNVITCGGSFINRNQSRNLELVAWNDSSGGFYEENLRFELPLYQVGLIDVSNDYSTKVVGVPFISAISEGLYYLLNGASLPIDGTSCGPPVMSALVALINEATQRKKWSYIDIYYYEYPYLFTYIGKGSNNIFDANNFSNWNPITGLGMIDGTRLLNLLNPSYIVSGDLLAISSKSIQNQMSFLNFFPPSPFFQEEIRQPVFGCQCYWSYLKVFRIDPATNRLDLNTTPLQDGDRIVIFSAVPLLHWVLTWNPIGYMYLQKYANDITDHMQWILTMEENAFYEPFTLSPYTGGVEEYVTSTFGGADPKSSPSVQFELDDSCYFFFRRHTWFLQYPTLYQTIVDTNLSYYTNLSNANYYMSSRYDVSNYKIGRSNVYNTDTFVLYDEFSEYPEFIMIPYSPEPSHVIPKDETPYMFFNTRIQAFVSNQQHAGQSLFLNINETSSPLRSFVFPSCLMYIVKNQPNVNPDLFQPTYSPGPFFSSANKSSSARYDDFIVQNFSISTPLNTFYNPYELIWMTDGENSQGNIILVPFKPTADLLYLFTLDPSTLLSDKNLVIWIRQVIYTFGFPNDAIYPNLPEALPFMSLYLNVDVSEGSLVGSWILDSSFDSDNFIYNANNEPEYFYVGNEAQMIFEANDSNLTNLVDIKNSKEWQPQMYLYDGKDTIGHWLLIPRLGPKTNYLYTCCQYDIRNVKTNRYLSTILQLSHTPAMLEGSLERPPQTYVCIYTPRNDLEIPPTE